MKFELVDFYPADEFNKRKNFVGTVHIYAIDCQLDIRGILVTTQGKGMFFNLPHFKAIDRETKTVVRYPLIRWTNDATHKEMMDFLHQKVKAEIWKRLNNPDCEVKLHDSRT
jgi:hypothetical protein